ncbi:MAG TPA: hypothetical protein VLI04_05285 [Nocardioidaceae bacterium]|nr:hypothetical protein [Nocardioidaceae bacterium]
MYSLLRAALTLTVAAPLALIPLSTTSAAAAETDPIVVVGRVTDGGTAASAARVEVRVWPTAAELAALPEGGRAEVKVAAVTQADAHGSYRLWLDPVRLRRYISSAGLLDVEVVSAFEGRHDRLAFSTAVGTTKTIELEVGAGAPLGGGVDLCVIEAGEWYYNQRERFLLVHNWAGAKATVEQAIRGDATHTLGLGLKVGSGAWESRGTRTMTWSESAEAGVSVSGIVNKALYNSVNYREFLCRGWQSGKILERYVRPVSFYDLLQEPHVDITHWNLRKGCTVRSTGKLWKKKGTNQTVKNGVDLPFLDLSAQSGYDAGTRVGFTIKQPTRVCSNSKEGWVTASRIELRSTQAPPPGVE